MIRPRGDRMIQIPYCEAGQCFNEATICREFLASNIANRPFRGLSERSEFHRTGLVCERCGELRTRRAVAVEMLPCLTLQMYRAVATRPIKVPKFFFQICPCVCQQELR